VLAAGAVIWRLTSPDEETGERREGQAMRFVGITFLVLTAAVVLQAGVALVEGHGAEESLTGIALLAASLLVMPVLSLLKLRTAAAERLPVLAVEARETIACSYLSLTALAGLVATAVIGWWWIDAAAALLLVPWLVREGLEAAKGENCIENLGTCFCRACTWGLRSCAGVCCGPAAA
jgi:divalent metal cation (Fe/Co/Zn/Cd) transporter